MIQSGFLLALSLSACAVAATAAPSFDKNDMKMERDFKALASNRGLQSWGCSDFDDIFSTMRQADPSGDKLFIDVGFNKGYQFALWASLWTPEVGITAEKWWKHLVSSLNQTSMTKQRFRSLNICGSCQDCLHGKFTFESEPPKVNAPKLQMIGVDLNVENIKSVNAIQQLISEETNQWHSRIEMTLIKSGVSNFTGTIKNRVCDVADEDCSLKFSNKRRGVLQELEVTTVDAIVTQLQTTKTLGKNSIDMLLIDTEGNDPLVIEGAFQTLQSGMVRCLIFEYHKRGYWKETTLQHVTESIGQLGYLCYFSVMGSLWPLNQGHWKPMYEVRRWSNVICLREGDAWFTALQTYVYQPQRFTCQRRGCVRKEEEGHRVLAAIESS